MSILQIESLPLLTFVSLASPWQKSGFLVSPCFMTTWEQLLLPRKASDHQRHVAKIAVSNWGIFIFLFQRVANEDRNKLNRYVIYGNLIVPKTLPLLRKKAGVWLSIFCVNRVINESLELFLERNKNVHKLKRP